MTASSDVAFTPAVKAVQERKGSRRAYARQEDGGGWATTITPDLATYISAQTSVFLATANAGGQPYIQHRGGPAGFLRILDERTIGMADYTGNRQFITTGNLSENPRAHLFLIDYTRQTRVKIWGTARIVEGDERLAARLTPQGHAARVEQVLLFSLAAWDANCPRHIPQRFEAADVADALAARDRRIADLEAALATLQASSSASQ